MSTTFEKAASLFADKKYEEFASFTAEAMTRELQNSLAVSSLKYSSTPFVPKVGSVCSRSPTKPATYVESDNTKPLHLCTRPAFELDKSLDFDKYQDLLTCMRVATDRLFYNFLFQYATVVKATSISDLFYTVRSSFGSDSICKIYASQKLGYNPEFCHQSSAFSNSSVLIDSIEPQNKILDIDTVVFVKDQQTDSGSIYISEVLNTVAPGVDPEHFPPIRFIETNEYTFDGPLVPRVELSFVTSLLIAIEDPLGFIVGMLPKEDTDS